MTTVTKLTIHTASVNVTATEVDGGEIPRNLTTLADTLIGLCKANGDLAWLADMVAEAKGSKYGVISWGDHDGRSASNPACGEENLP